MFFTQDLRDKAAQIITIAKQKNLKIAVAESCTGGLLSALLTEISGSSQVFECGFVTYSNAAKNAMLQVKQELLEKHGAVSNEVAVGMAQGVLKNSTANISVAITGIAGPEGGSQEKPIGLVYITAASSARVYSRKFNFSGDRVEIRKSSLLAALEALRKMVDIDK